MFHFSLINAIIKKIVSSICFTLSQFFSDALIGTLLLLYQIMFKMSVKVECTIDVNVYVGRMFHAQKALKMIRFLIFLL